MAGVVPRPRLSHSSASAPSPRGAELTAGRSPAPPRVFSMENSNVSSDGGSCFGDDSIPRLSTDLVPQVALTLSSPACCVNTFSHLLVPQVACILFHLLDAFVAHRLLVLQKLFCFVCQAVGTAGNVCVCFSFLGRRWLCVQKVFLAAGGLSSFGLLA